MTGLAIGAVAGAFVIWAAGRGGWIDQGDLFAAAALGVNVAGVGWWFQWFPDQVALIIAGGAVAVLAVFAWRALAVGVAALAVGAAVMFALIHTAAVDVNGPSPEHFAPGPTTAEVATAG